MQFSRGKALPNTPGKRAIRRREILTMQIGEPLRTIVVEPLELPVSEPQTQPDPERAPQQEPEPDQVPAKR